MRLVRAVRARYPLLKLIARAHSRSDAFEYAEMGVPAVRETFGSALEVFFLDLVTPWQPVRVVAFVLGAWGFVWMVVKPKKSEKYGVRLTTFLHLMVLLYSPAERHNH